MTETREIPALTLWQPWATLVAIGAKRIETRDWQTSYRGPIAIHAAKRDLTQEDHVWMNTAHEARMPLIEFGYMPAGRLLPLGGIVAVAKLTRIARVHYQTTIGADSGIVTDTGQRFRVPAAEFVLGDLSPGRYGWKLDDVMMLDTPIAASGAQTLWRWTVDPDIDLLLGERGWWPSEEG